MKGGMSKDTPLPKDWREGRRLRAWELYQQGWKQKDIAAALGVTEGAVSQWITKGKSLGAEALRHRPSPGAPPKLRPEQLAQLPRLLARGAEAFGFRGAVWTAGGASGGRDQAGIWRQLSSHALLSSPLQT